MFSRANLLSKLEGCAARQDLAEGLGLMASFVGAESHMLARYDVFAEEGFDYVITSNWPFDVVRSLGRHLTRRQAKRNEVDRCMSAMLPEFFHVPATASFPAELNRMYCVIPFDTGHARLALAFLFRKDIVLAQDRLHDVALIAAYYSGHFEQAVFVPDVVLDLTEREIECLGWIAEGKTSDEISMIIGISRNTVNNYITSIMRKTTTKTRSEAIAYAVRNSLI
jgi:LuxR family transcriptional regulator, regulator of acetate metabolism